MLIFSGVARLIANHPILSVFESAPEVRVLPSPGVTRLHRYYDPIRLPPQPPPNVGVEAATLAATGLPRCPDHLPDVPCPLPRRIERVHVSILPRPRGLPRFAGGSASATSLSRPAQASLALRPAGLLNRPRRPLSRGFGSASYLIKPLVSYQTNRLLSGWILPPLVIRAFSGHTAKSGTRLTIC